MSGVYYCSHDNTGINPTVYAFNNIIYGNKNNSTIEEFQLQLHCGKPIFRSDYNLIWNVDNLANGTGSGNEYFSNDYSIDVDPTFKDSANGDFS